MICITCDHDCHCNDICQSDNGCGCNNCEHKQEKNMVKKVRQLAEHYWMDHKVEVVIFAILVVSLIIK
jgi:maltodextrin utilization protein YvdJ